MCSDQMGISNIQEKEAYRQDDVKKILNFYVKERLSHQQQVLEDGPSKKKNDKRVEKPQDNLLDDSRGPKNKSDNHASKMMMDDEHEIEHDD